MKVLVLGGRGFIGRHVVAALLDGGHAVVVGSRGKRALRAQASRPDAPEIRTAHLERLVDAGAWQPLLDGVDVVVNCVGILRERPGETYEAIHHRAPAALAAACIDCGVGRLIHCSALGLRPDAANGFLTSKRNGEAALLRARLAVTIVRPSLLDGRGGFGAVWLRQLARLPVHVVPSSATGLIAPLDVGDLGAAIAALCTRPFDESLREVELGGPDRQTLADYLQALRRAGSRPAAITIRIPGFAARAAAWLCDRLHFSPFSIGHLELLAHDNVPKVDRLAALLGRAPRRPGRLFPASSTPLGGPGLPTRT